MTVIGSALLLATVCGTPMTGTIDLSRASVVARADRAPEAEKTAVTMLVEEAEKRTGIRWMWRTDWPNGAVIVAASRLDDVAAGAEVPEFVRTT